jgi:hypothetical protein
MFDIGSTSAPAMSARILLTAFRKISSRSCPKVFSFSLCTEGKSEAWGSLKRVGDVFASVGADEVAEGVVPYAGGDEESDISVLCERLGEDLISSDH